MDTAAGQLIYLFPTVDPVGEIKLTKALHPHVNFLLLFGFCAGNPSTYKEKKEESVCPQKWLRGLTNRPGHHYYLFYHHHHHLGWTVGGVLLARYYFSTVCGAISLLYESTHWR